MGFFSSRKSEPAPIVRHERDKNRDGQSVSGSPVAVIKSKWYSKSRSKTASEAPRLDDSMETEVTLRLDAYRRTAAGNDAESSRGQTDAVTKTMAERLNELTKSHAEGMIDDETYRDLRASLFERFGAASHPSAEQSHIRISGDPTLHAHPTNTSKRHSIGRPDSNFHLAPRPPSMSLSRPQTPSGAAHSIRSTTSRASTVATAVTGLLRRGTKNRRADQQSMGSRPGSPDNASMFSVTSSSAPQYYPRAYPGSNHSLASVGGARAPSLSSRRTGRSGLTSRTFATPPSSYHRHGYAYTATGTSSSTGMDTDVRSKTESEMSMSADLSEYDDKSPQELREAMVRTEREGRKLLDAFNGLELTILTKYRGTGGAMGMAGVGGVGPVAGWTHVNAPGEFGERHSMSMRRRPSQMKGKGSSSSLYTAPVPGLPPTQLHPNKARSLSLSGQNGGSTTSLRSRSPQPPTVQEEGFVDDPEMAQLHKEMEDIRRRRAQVASRYETRLEMLRVKLKSAELRDKVAR